MITMLEMICRQLLKRFHKKKLRAESVLQQTPNALCPKIFKMLEKIKSDSRICVCQWQNGLEFEVDHPYGPCQIVDLSAMTCSCGKWQLTRIPCIHACSAVYLRKHRLEEYVVSCYHLAIYFKSYEHGIHVVLDSEAWPKIVNSVILPLVARVQPRRPKKARQREPD